MVVFDTAIMLLSIRPDVRPPINPETNLPIEHAKERVDGLIEQLDKEGTKIIIPTPALSELLVHAGKDTPAILKDIQKSSVFEIGSFDDRAAVEVSLMVRQGIKNGNKRGAVGIDCPWTKVKFDMQIIAIAKVNGATTIYTDDGDIHAHAENEHLKVIRLIDIPVPQKKMKDMQEPLGFDEQEKNAIEPQNL